MLFKKKKYNPEMVSYWKTQDSVEAKVFQDKHGHTVMQMQGEKYVFPGYPRSTMLYGGLSPLKHNIKNKIFNDMWAGLEAGTKPEDMLRTLREETLPFVIEMGEQNKYDFVPYEKMNPPVKEVYRALTVIADGSATMLSLRDIFCFILQEDDAYRMRFQWIVKFFNPNTLWRKITRRDPIKDLDFALGMLEHAEVVGDMKERQRLFKRIVLFLLKDPAIRARFTQFIREVDWKKLELTKADKYFFRAKYFKVDYPEYKY